MNTHTSVWVVNLFVLSFALVSCDFCGGIACGTPIVQIRVVDATGQPVSAFSGTVTFGGQTSDFKCLDCQDGIGIAGVPGAGAERDVILSLSVAAPGIGTFTGGVRVHFEGDFEGICAGEGEECAHASTEVIVVPEP